MEGGAWRRDSTHSFVIISNLLSFGAHEAYLTDGERETITIFKISIIFIFFFMTLT